MKNLILVSIFAILTGCGGGGAGTPASSIVGKFAYVANQGNDNVAGFSINSVTGALTPIVGSPFSAGSMPAQVAVSPSGKFAYVTNISSNTISSYIVDAATGALTFQGTIPATGSWPQPIVVSPSSAYVYVANQNTGTVSSYSVNSATGALSDMNNTQSAGSAPMAMVLNQAGTVLYAVSLSDSLIHIYPVNASTGLIGPPSTLSTVDQPRTIAIDPSGKFAFVSGQGSDGINVYSIDQTTGELTFASNTTNGFAIALAIDSTGKYIYSVGAGGLDGYSINSTTGSLTPLSGSPFTTVASPISVSVDPSGKFVYVSGLTDGNNISEFSIDQSSGNLSLVGTIASTGTYTNFITTTAGF